MQTFVDKLSEALKDYIDPYLDLGIFRDEECMIGGEFISEKLAYALCESICMILVVTPKYFTKRHIYCIRECQAMLELEKLRLQSLNNPGQGLIIPVIFRMPINVPEVPIGLNFRDRLYFDFSKFTLADPRIGDSDQYAYYIERIAQRIYEIHEALNPFADDLCRDCESFTLPAAVDVLPWLETAIQSRTKPMNEFPGRRKL